MPILFSILPSWKPGRSPSTTKALMPRVPLPCSVIAKTVLTWAMPALVMKCFMPFRT